MGMNIEIKAAWVRSLRSGEIQQGQKKLHREDGSMCCLGVVCDLAVKAGIIPAPVLITKDQTSGGAHFSYEDGEGTESNYLPAKVQEWAGLDYRPQAEGFMLPDNELPYLDSMNDSGSYDFYMIADLIEKYL
jgi:hypothetical protein